MLCEIVKFKASDGLILHGAIYLPKTKSHRAVLHIHGLGGSFFGSAAIEELAAEYTANDIAFFVIEQRGSYVVEEFTRIAGKKTDDVMAGSALEVFEDSRNDILGGISYLLKSGYKDIFLEGHSTGCQKSIYFMSGYKGRHIKLLVLLSPVDDYNFDLKAHKERFKKNVGIAKRIAARGERNALMPAYSMPEGQKFIGAKRFLSTANPKNPESMILNFSLDKLEYLSGVKVPTLAVFGSKDQLMILPVELALEKMARDASCSLSTAIIKGADHGFHGKTKLLAELVVKWVTEHAPKRL